MFDRVHTAEEEVLFRPKPCSTASWCKLLDNVAVYPGLHLELLGFQVKARRRNRRGQSHPEIHQVEQHLEDCRSDTVRSA